MPTAFTGTKRRGKPRRGYVLMMTLALIVIAALATAGIARRSLQLANEAVQAQTALQHRWGATSCRRLLLDRAEEIFLRTEAEREKKGLPLPSPAILSAQVQLGGATYRLWLADEDAKANINAITARLPSKRRQILSALASSRIPFQLRPEERFEGARRKQWFSSWGQIVDLGPIWEMAPLDPLIELASQLTCWGGEKLNIRRASDKSVLVLATQLINPQIARKLIASRAETSDGKLDPLLRTLALKRKDESVLKSWFTDRSSCYSLWLELDDGGRRWYHQWVLGDRTAGTQGSYLSFTW